MEPRRQRQEAVREGLEPEPRTPVDRTVTGAVRDPRRARSTMYLLGLLLVAAGLGLFIYCLWYATNGGAVTIYATVATACVVVGAVLITGMRDRLGQRGRRTRS